MSISVAPASTACRISASFVDVACTSIPRRDRAQVVGSPGFWFLACEDVSVAPGWRCRGSCGSAAAGAGMLCYHAPCGFRARRATCPEGKPVATEAMLIPVPARAAFASATRFGYTHTAPASERASEHTTRAVYRCVTRAAAAAMRASRDAQVLHAQHLKDVTAQRVLRLGCSGGHRLSQRRCGPLSHPVRPIGGRSHTKSS